MAKKQQRAERTAMKTLKARIAALDHLPAGAHLIEVDTLRRVKCRRVRYSDPPIARQIAQMVSRAAMTCWFVRAMDSPTSDPQAARDGYEEWLEAQIAELLTKAGLNL